MNSYAKWFGIVVWIGIIGNILFGLLGLFAPYTLFSLFGLEEAVPTVWVRDAGLFVILVSLFYIPSARDPFANRYYAILLVCARFAYVIFWFFGVAIWAFGSEYLKFGIADLAITIPQAILLYLAFRKGPTIETT